MRNAATPSSQRLAIVAIIVLTIALIAAYLTRQRPQNVASIDAPTARVQVASSGAPSSTVGTLPPNPVIAFEPAMPTVPTEERAAADAVQPQAPAQEKSAAVPAKSAPAKSPTRAQNTQGNATAKANDTPPSDDLTPTQVAREALSLVGADPMAELYWAQAINDPSLSPHDRQDLIEDLNEEGFVDPKNITPDDLPLIERRLALIEALAPQAMDEVNAAAFAEAYKDLVNMYARVTKK